MLVFHGGLTEEQAEKIKKGEYKIFPKVPIDEITIRNNINTFCYCNSNTTYDSYDALAHYVSDDIYDKQYIFLFKYLNNALRFTRGTGCYTLVADVNEKILSEYMGIGNYLYEGYHIEYRVPGHIIIPEHVIEVAPCYSWELQDAIRERYPNNINGDNETLEAMEIMKQKRLEFTDYSSRFK